MDNVKFESLKINPIFNLTWCKEDTRYSDGDVEDTIIDILMDCEEEDYGQAVIDNFSWPVYYHLTPLRKNILSWYPFEKDKDILEIGCGLGSITNMLCDKARSVTSVELSKRRATGTLIRCREKNNLEIIVGNLNDIEFEKKYDYITLIGVLEYQGTYTESSNPYVEFLAKIKSLLKEDGKLLIAIENKYGLKYWCGAREDHTGVPFDGINQYELGNKTAMTFSKQELSEIAIAAGLEYQHFYYPYPDYKMPNVIFSENETFTMEKLINVSHYYIPDSKNMIASEKDLYEDLINNNEMPFFANSFLLELSHSNAEMGEVTYATLNNTRKKDLNVGTMFTSKNEVIKWNNQTDDNKHILECLDNLEFLNRNGLKTIPAKIDNGKLISSKIEANTVEEYIIDAYYRADVNDIIVYCDELMANINKSSKHIVSSNNLMNTVLDLTETERNELLHTEFGEILEIGMFDMIPRNAFLIDGEYHWFDQEWKLENIPVNYIFYHGIYEMYYTHPWMSKILQIDELLVRYGIGNEKKYYELLNKYVGSIVIDGLQVQANMVFRESGKKYIKKNIHALNADKVGQVDDISKIVLSIDKLLEAGAYESLVNAFSSMDESGINSFELKLFIRWIRNHSKDILSGKDTIISKSKGFYDVIDRISMSI